MQPIDLLRKYWGYDSFREPQDKIIESVLEGHDTLGLLPTGGGKSITFQIPALMLPGLTLVVTPLISLMKDQVDNLMARGIRAAAIHSGLSRAEVKLAFDRCALGKIKMLYISPERLQTETFVDNLRSMKIEVSLIVVDESHCISQWGYDFRPSYLNIASLRKVFPEAPVLALTASATEEVRADIQRLLRFRPGSRTFSKSFSRPNITFVVRKADHKPGMLQRVLKSTAGSTIVYVRSRRRCCEIAEEIRSWGITADYYHAGLSIEEKNERQNAWQKSQTRVIVATNAFGMGIDKPDVRTVVHLDLPPSIEEYYQEAGRAGRDGKPSYAVIITSPATDKASLTRRLNESFPPKDQIRKVYELACNFLDIAVGSGYNCLYEFNFSLFCERFKLQPGPTRSAMAILTRAGYWEYVDEVSTRSRAMVIMDKRALYDLPLDADTDKVFQTMLRTYTGLFADYVNIDEGLLCRRTNLDAEAVYQSLLRLSRLHAIHYIPKKTTPYIYLSTSRELPKHIAFPKSVYEDQRERMKRRIDAVKRLVYSEDACRMEVMLTYFGETPEGPCGCCDTCRERNRRPRDTQRLRESILHILALPHPIDYVAEQLRLPHSVIIPIIRQMADEQLIAITGSTLSRVCNSTAN